MSMLIMIKAKRFVNLLFIALFTLLLCVPLAQAENDVEGKTFYTMANIWYEKPAKILSTNYHKGAIIPFGTKVTINKMNNRKIKFTDEEGLVFRILFVRKHNRRGMTIKDYFKQYFSTEDPRGQGGPFNKFSKDEKRSIELGEIQVGMSKAAVLMAYGYPPSHRTPSLKSPMWKYWVNAFVTRAVLFRDGKVAKTRR